MSRNSEPWAIQRLKSTEETYQRRAEAERAQSHVDAVTRWHERSRSGHTAADDEVAASTLHRDLSAASRALLEVRRKRLHALYSTEKAQWQAALAQRGLAMVPDE